MRKGNPSSKDDISMTFTQNGTNNLKSADKLEKSVDGLVSWLSEKGGVINKVVQKSVKGTLTLSKYVS